MIHTYNTYIYMYTCYIHVYDWNLINKKLKNCAMTAVLKTRFAYTTITHKNLRLTLVFMWNSAQWEEFNFYLFLSYFF